MYVFNYQGGSHEDLVSSSFYFFSSRLHGGSPVRNNYVNHSREVDRRQDNHHHDNARTAGSASRRVRTTCGVFVPGIPSVPDVLRAGVERLHQLQTRVWSLEVTASLALVSLGRWALSNFGSTITFNAKRD